MGVVVDSLKKVENEKWGKKIHCYDQFWLYKHVLKELAPNMWLRMGLDNTNMADNVSFIVKVFYGSFSVNSERSGQDEVFCCKSCGNYHINPIKHAMLHCCETQLEREKFWQQVSDNLPVEFLVELNFLDEDAFYIPFLETRKYCSNIGTEMWNYFTMRRLNLLHRPQKQPVILRYFFWIIKY